MNAIREQNIQVAAGTIGASPSNSPLQLSVNAQGRLTTEQEFADIILKTAPDGAVTRLGDVARVELAASQYGLRSLLDNKQAVAIPIFQAPGANALQVSDQVRSTMKELSKISHLQLNTTLFTTRLNSYVPVLKRSFIPYLKQLH